MINKHVRSFFSFSMGPWFSALISFITVPITTYLIIPEEYGKASLFIVFYSILLQLILLGSDQSFVRFFYEKKEKYRHSLLVNCISIPLLLSVFIGILIIIFRHFLSDLLYGDNQNIIPIILLSLILFISVISKFSNLLIRMKKKGLVYSIIMIIGSFINVIGIISYALLIERSFTAIVFGLLISHIIMLISSIFVERKFIIKKPKINTKKMISIIKFGVPFVPAFIFMWLLNSMDKIALRYLSTFDEIGYYTAANKLVIVLLLIQSGFSIFWTPISYESYEKNPKNRKIFSKVSKLLASFMFIISLILIGFKDILIQVLDKSYLPAAGIMPFLIFYPIMYTVSETTVIGINFKKKTYWHFWITLIAASANLVGNLYLVPIYGAKGAAFSTGVSFIIFFYLRTMISQKYFPINYSIKRFTVSTIIILLVSYINSFVDLIYLEIGSVLLGIMFISLIYSDEQKIIYKTVIDNIKAFLRRKGSVN